MKNEKPLAQGAFLCHILYMAKYKWMVVVLLVLGAAWGIYRFYLSPASLEPAGIFVITPLEYGETTVEGIIRQADNGQFLLEVDNITVVDLSLSNLGEHLNQRVTVSGTLYPPGLVSTSPFLEVTELSTTISGT